MNELDLNNLLHRVTLLISKVDRNTKLLLEIEKVIKTSNLTINSSTHSNPDDFLSKFKNLESSLSTSSEILKKIQDDISDISNKIESDS